MTIIGGVSLRSLLLLALATISVSFQRIGASKLPGRNVLLPVIPSDTVFEAQIPMESIYGLVGTSLVLMVAGSVWWTQIIPQKRLELSKSKRQGQVSEMLDELRELESTGSDARQLERWFYTDWIQKVPGSDKPAALPFLKKAKWNSGDNPVLVAFAAIFSVVLAASLAERGGAGF